MRKIDTLDGLRGYAILMVIYHHLPRIQHWPLFNKLPSLFRFGYLGVDIFFVLSGFLITRILISEKIKNNFSFRRFYAKRALRIFPIYYLLIIVLGISYSWDGMLPNALYISNYYFSFNTTPHPLRHTWSLSVEEHFYLVWPLIIYYFTISQSEKIIKYLLPAIAIISAILTVMLIDAKTAEALIYRGTNYRILSLSIGGFLAFKETFIIKTKPVYLFSAAAIIMIVYHYVETPGITNALLNLFLLTAVSMLIFIFARNVNDNKNFLRWLFVNPVITFVGKISYGLYLYHFPVLYFFGLTYNQIQFTPVKWQAIILPVVTSFAIATLSYFVIEKYFLSLKKNLSLS